MGADRRLPANWLTWLSATLLLCACRGSEPKPAPAAGPASRPTRVTLSVLAVNDVHGHLEQLPLLGGYVNNVRAARSSDGGGCLLLDAGDIFQGTLASNLEEGAGMIAGYDALRVNAAALGNHEFDFGPVGPRPLPLSPGDNPLGALEARIAQAGFPVLSVNLHKKRDVSATAVAGLERSAILWSAGVRVGIIGGITEAALFATQAENVAGLEVAPLPASLAAEATALRARGASVVIAVVHAGGECKRTGDPNDASSCLLDSELFELARALPSRAVDLIVGGHTHGGVAHLVNGIAVIESYANGQAFGRVDLTLERPGGRVVATKIFEPEPLCKEAMDAPICVNARYEGAQVTRDARVAAAISPYVKRAQERAGQLLGVEIEHAVTRSSGTESPLSNLVVDLMLAQFPAADAALNNGGAVRAPLPAGPLTYGQVFEAFPFDNSFAELSLDAGALSAIVARSLQGNHSVLALAGLRAVGRCEDGQLRVVLHDADGTAIPEDRVLRVVTSDYLSSRGDGLLEGIVAPESTVVHRGRLIREALVEELRKLPGGHLDGNDLRFFDGKHPRIAYPGQLPVTCR